MIPQEEYDRRVRALMAQIMPTEQANGPQTTELFFLYNDRFKPQETGVHCGGCRKRVFNKMLAYFKTLPE